MWVVNGHAEWSTSKLIDGRNGYHVYATEVENSGLYAGGRWRSIEDWPHAQLRMAASPISEGLTVIQIDKEMKKRFGKG